MDYQQKILLAVTALLVVFAMYLALTTVPAAGPTKPADTSGAQNLLLKALGFGLGEKEYTYSFSEDSNGYKTSYSLVKGPAGMMVSVQNPLSIKRAFFLENDTILCIRYPASANETCGSVKGNADVANYMTSLRYKFLNDTIIERNERDMRYLLNKSYAKPDPEITEGSVNGKRCSRITYTLDMSNMTVDDAARFGVGPTTPRSFSWEMCIDSATGIPYEKKFNYTYKDMAYRTAIRIASFTSGGAPAIVPPEDISGDPVTRLYQEREQQVKLATCFTDQSGEERDKCVANTAIGLKRADICDLAGPRRDRCLVSLIPLTKDNATCLTINDPSYKDDCYIELAGAYKNNTFCASVKNESKVASCEEAAKPLPPQIPETQPPPVNETNSINMTDFMNAIDKIGENATAGNATGGPASNTTG